MEPLCLKHKELVQSYAQRYPQNLCETSFTTLWSWRKTRPVWVLEIENSLVFLQKMNCGAVVVLGDPLGPVTVAQIAARVPNVRGFDRITSRLAEQIRATYPQMSVTRDVDNDEYVYRASDLAELPGHKYQNRRRAVVKTLEQYPTAQRCYLGPSDVPECLELLAKWRDSHTPVPDTICAEAQAVEEALANWQSLPGLLGTGMRVDGRLVAFGIAEALTPDTVVCHFEKTDRDIPGAGAVIVKWAAERAVEMGFKYINREQDCGSPGLRQAKRSYLPSSMVEKFKAESPAVPHSRQMRCGRNAQETVADTHSDSPHTAIVRHQCEIALCL
eukprot:m51a1_g4192 hypothetical protein (330) ;mRNA; r:403216-404274